MLKKFKDKLTGTKVKAVEIPDNFDRPIFVGDWIVQAEDNEFWIAPVVYSKEEFNRRFKRIG